MNLQIILKSCFRNGKIKLYDEVSFGQSKALIHMATPYQRSRYRRSGNGPGGRYPSHWSTVLSVVSVLLLSTLGKSHHIRDDFCISRTKQTPVSYFLFVCTIYSPATRGAICVCGIYSTMHVDMHMILLPVSMPRYQASRHNKEYDIDDIDSGVSRYRGPADGITGNGCTMI